jgi:hypothetical protein
MKKEIIQKNIFGGDPEKVISAPKKTGPTPRPPLPKLDLLTGLDETDVKAEAVFWMRLNNGQKMRSLSDALSQKHLIKTVINELKLKNGISSPTVLTRDMLLYKNLEGKR